MQVFGSDSFGESLARFLGADFERIEKTVFPDFEVRPRILAEKLHNRVIIAERMKVPTDPNAYLVEVLFEIMTLRDMGAKSVEVVMPYFVYSRQDKSFRQGEPFSAQYVVDMLKFAGARRIYVVESHTQNDFNAIVNVSGFRAIGKYFHSLGMKESVIIAPDEKAERGARIVAEEIGGALCVLRKKRDRETGEIETRAGDVPQGNRAIIVDDIVSSGRTMLNAVKIAKKHGMNEIYCAVVHPITQRGIFDVSKEATKFFACNTVDSALSVIPVEQLVAEEIKRYP